MRTNVQKVASVVVLGNGVCVASSTTSATTNMVLHTDVCRVLTFCAAIFSAAASF